jgi:hypothetical protein
MLAQHQVTGDRSHRDLAAGSGESDRDRKIEAGSLLPQRGRSEVHYDTLGRVFEAAVLKRRPHAISAFAHLGAGKPDDGKRGETVRDINLGFDWKTVDADDARGTNLGKHTGTSQVAIREFLEGKGKCRAGWLLSQDLHGRTVATLLAMTLGPQGRRERRSERI